MHTLQVRDIIRFAWGTFKKRPGMLVGGIAVALAITFVTSFLLEPGDDVAMSSATFILGLVSGAISLLIEIGMLTFTLRAHDNVETVGFKDLWNPKPFLWYLIGQFLVGLVVLAGFILLIVPGIIAMMGLLFASYLIVDRNMGPIAAMKESWRITKGHRWHLFLLVLALAGLNILGFVALIVGLLVTVPVTMLALAHAYRMLEHQASELAPVPTA